LALASNCQTTKGFLCLTEYYRRLVKGYDTIGRPSTDMLRKDNCSWTWKAMKLPQYKWMLPDMKLV